MCQEGIREGINMVFDKYVGPPEGKLSVLKSLQNYAFLVTNHSLFSKIKMNNLLLD
jgi:hypothetical protein